MIRGQFGSAAFSQLSHEPKASEPATLSADAKCRSMVEVRVVFRQPARVFEFIEKRARDTLPSRGSKKWKRLRMTRVINGRWSPAATLTLILTAMVVLLTVAAPASAQRSRTARLTQRIKKLEKKLDSLNRRMENEAKRVGERRKRAEKDHKLVLDPAFHDTLGELIASTITRHANSGATNGHRSKGAFQELGPEFKKKFGRVIFEVTESALKDMVTLLIEEHNDISPKRCARDLRAFMQDVLPRNFSEAWTKKLMSRCSKKLADLQQDHRKLTDEIDGLRAALTGNIKGAIPQNMVAVPASEGFHGWTAKEIKELAEADASNIKRNKYLLLGSARNKQAVAAFLIDRTEVTHDSYWYFCESTGHRAPLDKAEKPLWPDGKIPEGWGQRPICYVSLDDAMEYAAWIGARLPTEQEWEAAARSGKNGYDGRYWAWGNDYKEHLCNDNKAHSVLERRRMYSITPKGIDLPAVLPVGHFKAGATPLGIHDMNGNIAEWTTSPFLAYKSFADQKLSKYDIQLSEFSFDSEKITVKGGHCDQRNLIVASAMRLGVHPMRGKKNLGFRCARSATPGLDLFNNLTSNHQLDSRLSDFPMIRGDARADRDFPVLDSRSNRYAVMEKLQFNEELGVRGKAESIFIASRLQNELTSPKSLKEAASDDGELEGCFLLGFLKTDVGFTEPALEPGSYFVAFKTGGVIENEETKKKTKVKDAILFVPKKTGSKIIRFEAIRPSSMVASKVSSPTILESSTKDQNDILTLVFSYDIKVRSKGAFQVILNLKAKKGALNGFE